MFYAAYEFNKQLLSPLTYLANAVNQALTDPTGYLSHLPGAKEASSLPGLFYRLGKTYEKPEFGIHQVEHDSEVLDATTGKPHKIACPVVERVALETPFCRLLRFKRFSDDESGIRDLKDDPVVLIVAPLSGHHATLLRDTVQTMLVDHKVYITDWANARDVGIEHGTFSLDDYVRTVEKFIRYIGRVGAKVPHPELVDGEDRIEHGTPEAAALRKLHVVAVCQPVVPVLGAISLMAARGEATPASMTLMGGPVDARMSPTGVDNLATKHPLSWFKQNLIDAVPQGHLGTGRKVYPGFLQHMGFVAMNPQRHMKSYLDFYEDLRQGDVEGAKVHRTFYDEYNAVLDMDAEYYLDTIKTVFQDFALAQGTWAVGGEFVRPEAITHTALLTVEGELDDISGQGQTHAALALCSKIKGKAKQALTIPKVGHYGLFSGHRWRDNVYPKIRDFIAANNRT